jgi:hypothetical protein
VFVSTLGVSASSTWGAPVWIVPSHTDLERGSFAFATTGAFAGLVIPHENGTAIVGPAALAQAVDRVLEQRQGTAAGLASVCSH